jgi:hypothetical protein
MRKTLPTGGTKSAGGAVVAVAGLLASSPTVATNVTPEAAEQATESVIRSTLATPEQIDQAILKLSPGALKRVLLNLRGEDRTRVADPSHNSHNSAAAPGK